MSKFREATGGVASRAIRGVKSANACFTPDFARQKMGVKSAFARFTPDFG